MSRRIARETALQVLFQVELAKGDPSKALEYTFKEFVVPEASQGFARKLIDGTLANLQEIDEHLKSVSKEWNLQRMANVDRNILRLAAYELLFCPDIPGSVTVNEAIELAKIYSGHESGKFVNGVLGALLLKSGKSRAGQTGENVSETVPISEPGPVVTTERADVEPVVKGEE